MRYLLLFLALAVVAVVVILLARPTRLRGNAVSEPISEAPLLGLAEASPVLPPVVLPEHPTGADVENLRFSVGLRGYRCDQVDHVLDSLGAEIDELRTRLGEGKTTPEKPVPEATQPPEA